MPMSTFKLGRNEPCWCRSGKKFKKCHLNRERATPLNAFQLEAEHKKSFEKRYCLHPEASSDTCDGDIVKAHTVQRSGGLSNISVDGHVLRFDWSMRTLIENNGSLAPQKIGINRASTFTGFCGRHDNSLFAEIEKKPYQATPEQSFVLGYRAICRELFMKTAAYDATPLIRQSDRGKDFTAQRFVQSFADFRQETLSRGLRDLRCHKDEYDNCLVAKTYSSINQYVLEFEEAPEILCCFGCSPEYDFRGNTLQDLEQVDAADVMTCSIITRGEGGAVVFSWLAEKHDACSRLIRSLNRMPSDRLPDAIVRFVFESGENVFFSPRWWMKLDDTARARIHERAQSGVMVRRSDCLKDDGSKFVSWTITRKLMDFGPWK
jgi:hypothetical protein